MKAKGQWSHAPHSGVRGLAYQISHDELNTGNFRRDFPSQGPRPWCVSVQFHAYCQSAASYILATGADLGIRRSDRMASERGANGGLGQIPQRGTGAEPIVSNEAP